MKKVFTLILIAVVTLFSGVILSSCGENQAEKTIVIRDDSGLSDIIVLDMSNGNSKTVQASGKGVYKVPTHADIRVEINAGDFGVDFSNLEIVQDGRKLEKTKDIIETGDYSPIPDVGTSRYGYFNIPSIEKNVSVTLLNVKMISSTFNFEVQNLEATQTMLEKTQINVSSTDEEEFMSFYEFLTSDYPSLTRDFDLTLEPELNSYRTFRLKFDGVIPFEFQYGSPFKLVSGEDELETTFTQFGNQYILDLGAENIGAEFEYTISVDFSSVNYKEFEINLPQDNQTFSISSSASTVTLENIGECHFELTKKMSDPVFDVTANYDDMQVLANGVALEYKTDEEYYVFPETVRSPYDAQVGATSFSITVSGITYSKNGEDVTPIILSSTSLNPSLSQSSFSAKFYGVNELGERTVISGVDEEGQSFGFEGQTYILAWEYPLDNNTNSYRTLFDLSDVEVGLKNSQETLFNLSEILPSDNSSLVDNTFTHQVDVQVLVGPDSYETRHYNLKAIYNEQTNLFDSFELQFACYTGSNEFEFGFKEYKKNIDISLGFEHEDVSVRCALFDANNEMLSESWRVLGNDPLTVSVSAYNMVAFEIVVDQNDFVAWYDFAIEDSSLASLTNQYEEIEAEPGKRGFIIKFIVSDLYYSSNAPFVLIRNS